MAQRLTKLQVEHLREKLRKKREEKIGQWEAENHKPMTFIDQAVEDLEKHGDDAQAVVKAMQSKWMANIYEKVKDITSLGYDGNHYLVVKIKVKNNPEIERYEEKLAKITSQLVLKSEEIIDKAVFIGAAEALAMLENF